MQLQFYTTLALWITAYEVFSVVRNFCDVAKYILYLKFLWRQYIYVVMCMHMQLWRVFLSVNIDHGQRQKILRLNLALIHQPNSRWARQIDI
jgi:hypothetical protein